MEPYLKKLIDDFCSEADGVCPDVVEEFRDKRVDWSLRELMTPDSEGLVCTLWPLRKHSVDNIKEHCQFCGREIVVDRANAAIVSSYVCMVCWLRAGAPGYGQMGKMTGGEKLTPEEAAVLDKGGQGRA
jgi:hypothetical protein